MSRQFLVLGFWQNSEPFSVGVIESPTGNVDDLLVTGGDIDVDQSPPDYDGPWGVVVDAIDPESAEPLALAKMLGCVWGDHGSQTNACGDPATDYRGGFWHCEKHTQSIDKAGEFDGEAD